MSKKELLTTILIAGLSILFAVICLILFFNGGKSEKWIKRKIKIGALLLTLNSVTPGIAQKDVITCYKPVINNQMSLESHQSEIVIKKHKENQFQVHVNKRSGKDFSYCIKSSEGKILDKNTLQPIDGKFDQSHEIFNILIKNTIGAGHYFVFLYDVPVKKQRKDNYRTKVQIEIKDE